MGCLPCFSKQSPRNRHQTPRAQPQINAPYKNAVSASQAPHSQPSPQQQHQAPPSPNRMTASILDRMGSMVGSRKSSRSPSPAPPTRRPKPADNVPPPPYAPAGDSTPIAPPAGPAQPVPSINLSTPAASGTPSVPLTSIATDEEKLKHLADFDTVFLIDDSGSMAGSNWRQTCEALSAIVAICTKYDTDGVDIHFLNHANTYVKIRSDQQVLSIFKAVKPTGITPTGRRLEDIMEPYIHKYKRLNGDIKPLNIICITDGEPTDPDKLERAIVRAAKKLDELEAPDRQMGIQFFQVGSDEAATEALEELDNALNELHGVRDMVDTVSWKRMNEGNGLSANGILKVVLGAVDKKIDSRRRLH